MTTITAPCRWALPLRAGARRINAFTHPLPVSQRMTRLQHPSPSPVLNHPPLLGTYLQRKRLRTAPLPSSCSGSGHFLGRAGRWPSTSISAPHTLHPSCRYHTSSLLLSLLSPSSPSSPTESSRTTPASRTTSASRTSSSSRGTSPSSPSRFRSPSYSTSTAPRSSSPSADTVPVTGGENSIVITPSCAEKVSNLDSKLLRVMVEGGGCSGFQYKFEPDSEDNISKRADRVFEAENGARVVVDIVSLDLLGGATLDYEDTMIRAAFIIKENPMSDASCSCGVSFAPK
eukprot:TRINITY_DN2266_c0_g1_i1.p1 TRINITY_DN2266_c0_g1~~TRINITY_DN2266_c0_g1_i1.p1  ORF type:complete len:308 (+),score=35.50 TRINITY_DN2266_c0_g1_i1:66-926(+)